MAMAGCCNASSRPRKARIGGAESIWRSAGGYSGSPRAMKRTPILRREGELALDLLHAGDADRPLRAAAPREIGQRVERRARAAAIVDQRAEGARADVLRADQPQPVEPLVVAEPRAPGLRVHGSALPADFRFRSRDQAADIGAVLDPQQQRQRAENGSDVAAPHRQRRERRRDAGGERRGRGIAGRRRDREPDQREGDRRRPEGADQSAEEASRRPCRRESASQTG